MKGYRDTTWRYLKKQWKRTALTTAGIILSVALITAMGTMFVSFRDMMIRDTIEDTGDYYAEYPKITAGGALQVKDSPQAEKVSVIRKDGVAVIAPVGDQARGQGVPPYKYLLLDCFDPSAFEMFTLPLAEGRLPQAPGELLLDKRVLENLPGGPRIGDRITLAVGDRYSPDGKTRIEGFDLKPAEYQGEVFKKRSDREFTIVGITESRIKYSEAYFFNGFTFMEGIEESNPREHDVYLKTRSVKGVTEQAEAIAEAIGLEKKVDGSGPPSYPINYNDRLLRLSAQSTSSVLNDSLITTLVFLIVLVVFCTIFVIYNTFNISVMERVSQFGTLRCIGATPGQVRAIVYQEAAILSLLGIPLGLFFGVITMKLVLFGICQIPNNALNFLQEFQVIVSVPVLLTSAALGVATVFLSALGPARQASRVSPLDAVRNTGSFRKEGFKKVKRSRFAQFLLGVEGQLAAKNLRRNPKRFRITLFSMVISIVLYIVFGSLVSYIFTIGAVPTTPDADFLFSIKEGEEQGFTPELYQEVKALPGVSRVYKNINADVSIMVPQDRINPRFTELREELLQDRKAGTVRYPKGKLASYGEAALPVLEKALHQDFSDSLNQNGVILLVNNEIYDPVQKKWVILKPFDYQVGDEIQVSTGSVPPRSASLRVMGIMEKGLLDNQYGQNGEVLMITTEEVYRDVVGGDYYRQMAIKLAPGADREPVVRYLREKSAGGSGFEYVDFVEAAAKMRNAAVTVSIFLYGFVVVIVLIGCLNITNTISTNLILRTRELSVLKAVGMTQNGIKKLVALEGSLYGAVSAVYGGVIGVALSYLMFRSFFKIKEFTWTLPWEQVITAAVGALLVSLAAGYLPLRRINQGIIVENLRFEE